MRSLTETWVENTLQIQKSMFEIATGHVLVVSKQVAESFNPHVIAGQGLRFFRHTDGGDHVFLTCPPDRLDAKANQVIAQRCDGTEKQANKRVKTILAEAIHEVVGDKPVHMFEIGCGRYTVANNMSRDMKLTFTGIDKLTDQKMTIVTSPHMTVTNFDNKPVTLEDVVRDPIVEEGHIPVVTAVYSLHFLDKQRLPAQLMNIIDFEGFFVGNLHLVGTRKEKEAQLTEMRSALDSSGMAYTCIRDGHSNSFFVIADEDNYDMVDRVEDEIKRQMAKPSIQRMLPQPRR
ncbi:MAG: hypothetical protein MRY79_00440 [Alphaproteobacteria bacterium]|nr:hypothetical protein [Alphaproteobacteria bacterium]